MTPDCIFCKIIAGDIPCHRIYEDEQTLAFLDIHPINPGHALVIPKQHIPDLEALDPAAYHAVMTATHGLMRQAKKLFHPQKVGLAVIGFDVPHAHVHVVPLHDHEDITSKRIVTGDKSTPTPEELTAIVQKYAST